MEVKTKTRVAKSLEALEKLLHEIETGERKKPDWIRLQGSCRLDKLKPKERTKLLQRIHPCVLRGFKANNVKLSSPKKRLAYWRSVASNGFHDFTDLGWMKSYNSPFVEDYDYIGPYLEGGLQALDAYAVYSAVLGTFEFGVEDFVRTRLCRNVRTIVEPMAGTADFAYQGHFRYPDFRYVMIDLDEDAQRRVLAQRWLPDTEKQYLVANVLDEEVWRNIKSFTTGESLAYIGKQSHHLFDVKQLHQLLECATRHVDYFMLEVPQLVSVVEMGGTDDMSRPEMDDAEFEAELVEDPDGEPNPFTNLMHFTLEASDETGERPLFYYRDWTVWQQATLVALGRLLDLNVLYYHSERNEFVSVEDGTDDCDVEDNVTFMLFTRRDAPYSPTAIPGGAG
jgi:hypothetical protein